MEAWSILCHSPCVRPFAKGFPLKIKSKAGATTFYHSFNIVLEILASVIRQRERGEGRREGKKKEKALRMERKK